MLGEERGAPVGAAGWMARRAWDVLDMQRAARRGGIRSLLRWLSSRVRGDVLLINPLGAIMASAQRPRAAPEQDLAVRTVREATARGLTAVTVDQDGLTCVMVSLGGTSDIQAPLLAAVVPCPATPQLSRLLADAAAVLSLSWQVEYLRGRQHQVQTADARVREAVLHLLMNGHAATARQIAGALLPALPDMARIYVIEVKPAARDRIVDEVAEAAKDAWIVPCPVYADHMIVLAPADSRERSDGIPAWAVAPFAAGSCTIGASGAVALGDTASGYAQAFHALAVARHGTQRYAVFAASADLAHVIGPDALPWARRFLMPLHAHQASRPQDPDSGELLATAVSWLTFASCATAHLKIHRNTLAARLALIQRLLRLDLDRLADQAALALAVRVVETGITPRAEPDAAPAHLDELLALPQVADWARRQFHPLRGHKDPGTIVDTLTTWLCLDTHIAATATALSLSPSAVRKRLIRGETLLERSLLRPPSAVHDLWLAQRSLELTRNPALEPRGTGVDEFCDGPIVKKQ